MRPLLQMMQICDSLFPIGAFTLSNGLETLVAKHQISDGKALENFVDDYLQLLPYNDLGVMMLAYKHATDRKWIDDLDALSTAYKSPAEVRIGCKKLCSRFLKIYQNFEGAAKSEYKSIDAYRDMILHQSCTGNHAIIVGLFAYDIKLDLSSAASLYVYSLLNAIVTNGVKMIPLSQNIGQQILSRSQKKIIQAIEIAKTLTIDAIGIGGTGFDIAGMKHEELYTRLYMS